MPDKGTPPPSARPLAEQYSQRLADLESLRSWATNLMTVADHDTIKQSLRLVIGDLDHGFQLLDQQRAHDEPGLWTMVELTTEHARLRLRLIADLFEAVKPNAEFRPAGQA